MYSKLPSILEVVPVRNMKTRHCRTHLSRLGCQFHGVTTCLCMCLYLRLHLREEVPAVPVYATIPSILNKLIIDMFDNFHSSVLIVRTTDQTCRQHIPNYCLIIRASNSEKFLKRGLFDDIRTAIGFTGRFQPNDITCYGFCHSIYFFIRKPL
jgi:hypothetical protein